MSLALHGARCALAATAALALSVSCASAASYDQVDRGNGSVGASPFFPGQSHPVLTSDSGRRSWFSTTVAFAAPDFSALFPPVSVRDVVTDRTTSLALDGDSRIVGMDAAERTLLLQRIAYEGETLTSAFFTRPVGGGPERIVSDGKPAASAAISGDGRSIVLSSPDEGTRILTLATGASRTVGPQFVPLGRFSVSDDASVIGGPGGYYVGGAFTEVPHSLVVSPNGSTVAWIEAAPASDARTIHARAITTGAELEKALPGYPTIQWISPDGGRVVYADPQASVYSETRAGSFDTRTAETKPFSDAYGPFIGGNVLEDPSDRPAAVISRNGRFATINYAGGRSALVDLDGRTLPGGGDPLSASSYVQPSVSRFCVEPGEADDFSYVLLALTRPAPWAPKPLAATVAVQFDGRVAKSALLTKPYDDANPTDPRGSVWLKLPTTVKSVSYRVTVLDARGRVVTGTGAQSPKDCAAPDEAR